MSFEEKIQQWVLLDNQLRNLSEKIRELREKKNNVGENINHYVETNNLSNAVVQISDGKLKFAQTRVTAPLTLKYVEKSLGEIIKNETQVKQIMDYLKQKRESKIVPEIKRFSNN
jgi:aldehyde:ferredoxin oxidoreductase